MSNDIFRTRPKQVTINEEVGCTLKGFTLQSGDASTGASASIELAPLDENGNWEPSFTPIRERREDDLTSSDPAKRYEASMVLALFLKASVITQGLHPLADAMIARALAHGEDIRGLPLFEGAKVVLNLP